MTRSRNEAESGASHDRNQTDFTAYGSYNWVPDSEKPTGDPRLDNALLDTRVRNAVDGELKVDLSASKGLTLLSGLEAVKQ